MRNIDFTDFKFVADDQIRYENGYAVSGHNIGCWRGIRIQSDVSRDQSYIVTIYNLDGNINFWEDNIQMAPKQMKIISRNDSIIEFRGYGFDSLGSSFADFGLSLHYEIDSIVKFVLHLHDRNINIEYLNSTSKESQSKLTADNISLIPSSNIEEVLDLSNIVLESYDLQSLNNIYNKIGNYNHPQICYDFGVRYYKYGDKLNAKKVLLKGVGYGIKYPCSIYNHTLIDAIGQCISILMIHFPIINFQNAIKATALGYIYLSRCIEMAPREAQDSYRTRALLFNDHANPVIVQTLILQNIGISTLKEPFIISDFYFASQATDSPYMKDIDTAIQIHRELEDISIGGKDADEYTLKEIALVGEQRHFLLFKALEQKFKNGDFNLTFVELENLI